MAGDNFERYVKMMPVSWKTLLAHGINFFTDELEAERVQFEVVNNGVTIGIVCDEDNQRDAAEFWKNHVQPVLEGEN